MIDRFRHVRPDIAFSSDFIVGFPGETEEDFAATLALVGQIEYAAAYSFKYSPRPGTPAEMQETVSTADMDERLVRLQNLIDSQQSAFNRTALGRTIDVLFERAGRKPGPDRRPHRLSAARPCSASDAIIGQVLPVTVASLERYSLFGTLASMPAFRAPLNGAPPTGAPVPTTAGVEPLPKSASDAPPLAPSRKPDMHAHPKTQVVIDFEDNRAVSALVGPYGQNLAQLERRLGVVVDSRGNHITISRIARRLRRGTARAGNALHSGGAGP